MPVSKGRRPGTWRVTVWARGKQHEQVFEGSKAAAQSLEASERLRLGSTRHDPARSAPTFSAFSTGLYRPHAEGALAASTWSVRRYQLTTLEGHFGPLKLTEIRSADVDAYILGRKQEVRERAINNELRVLRAMLGWGRERGIAVAPVKIRLLRAGEARVFCWSLEDVARVLKAARTTVPGLVPLVIFMLNTGLRKGEVVRAEWSWVDKRAALLRVPVTSEWTPKSKRAREVPLSRAALAVLRGLPKAGPYLFPQPSGERFKAIPRRAWRRMMAAAKIKGTPHTTRHTFASHFLARVPDLQLLATILGHSFTRTTELYAHLLPDHLSRARNAVNLTG
jgi:integrase